MRCDQAHSVLLVSKFAVAQKKVEKLGAVASEDDNDKNAKASAALFGLHGAAFAWLPELHALECSCVSALD